MSGHKVCKRVAASRGLRLTSGKVTPVDILKETSVQSVAVFMLHKKIVDF